MVIMMSGRSVNRENEDWFVSQVDRGRLQVFRDGRVKNVSTGRFIGAIGSGRYPKISLKDIEGKKIRHIQSHRLIYRVFKGPIPDGAEIDHENDDTSDCSADNLFALTPSQNVNKAIRTGRIPATALFHSDERSKALGRKGGMAARKNQ